MSLFLTTMHKLGLDARPMLRYLRARLLRPMEIELRGEIAQLRNDIAQLHGESARLRSDIARLSSDIARLHGDIAQSHGEMARLHSEVAQLHSAISELRGGTLRQRVQRLELLLPGDPLPAPDPQVLRKSGFSFPVVSIVMPVRNRAHGVAQAIASVQAQRFTDWELIVVDDGSTDASARTVALLSADARIRYFYQSPQGAAIAINRALHEARGSLIAYLDSDNLWYPDFLAVAVAAFAGDPGLQCAYGALVSDVHLPPGERILFEPFDRARLLQRNYIDRNTVVHRQSMVAVHGGADEALTRLLDWDQLLRYTADAPAHCLPVLAARYRVIDEQRISTVFPVGPNYFHVRQKWPPAQPVDGPVRVLYVLWQYPQLCETYVETEIGCMKRWGVHVEIWSESCGACPYESAVTVHRGTLAAAIAAAAPHLLHVHWLGIAHQCRDALITANLPWTLRTHGFDTSHAGLAAILSVPTLRRVFCFPSQIPSGTTEPRLQPLPAAFDTTLFQPQPDKDRRLVLRASAALQGKDLESFLHIARQLPEHRFVLAAVTCSSKEDYADQLQSLWRRAGSPGELMLNVPRRELALLVAQAGLYLHTTALPGEESGAAIGMPVSIAEAMATGAHILVREEKSLAAYVAEAGSAYRDAQHAVQLIAETAGWSDMQWKQAWMHSVDRAFMYHADEIALRPLYEEWCAIVDGYRAKGAQQEAKAAGS